MSEPSKPAYRQRPLEAEAVQWTGTNPDQLRAFAGSDFDTIEPQDRIEDPDQAAQLLVEDSHWVGIGPGDWVLKFEGYFVAKSDAAFRAVWEPAVSSPAPADRGALRDRDRALALLEAADFLRDAHFRDGLSVQEIGTALRHAVDAADPMVGSLARDGFGLGEIAAMPDTAALPAVDLAAAPDPTPLRWGLNDTLWGDDDTVTVLLSGPAGEPYWLELDPERAAVLREDLAGPDGGRAVDRAAVLREAAEVVEAMNEGCGQRKPCASCDAREDAADALRRLAGEARDEREAQAAQPKRPPMDPVHILGIGVPADEAQQPEAAEGAQQ
jgi:hypothetical protein